MSDRLTAGELERLRRYMPPGWQERIEPPLTPDQVTRCVSHLQALLSTVGTYLPRAVLVGGRAAQIGQGEFRFGTVLFADVSGFTPLTERFSRRVGREGAEEITLIVNRLLEVVNGIAVRYGGDLLKFAGDAALSFYQGAEHAARACCAAWEMQRAMRERFAHVTTSLGEFPLRMSIGLGSGDVFLASLGTPDNAEYAVMGPALAAMGHAEHLAQAGQIFIDQATRQLAGTAVTAAPTGEAGFFELRSVEPRSGAVEHPDLGLAPPDGPPHATLRWLLTRLDALTPYLTPGLLHKLLPSPRESKVESDHRWVTTLFTDLRGIDVLIEALGPEHVDLLTRIVNRHFLTVRDVVERYEGVLHKVGAGPSGPHLLITFGAPRSHADDPERAVRAALEMQERLTELNHEMEQEVESALGEMPGLKRPLLRQAIGITTGFVFAGSVGATRRWEYTVMGDLVNLAARLMVAAADGEVLVAEETTRYLEGRFDLQPCPPLRVKGKREPVSCSRVLGLAPFSPQPIVAEGRIVDRRPGLERAEEMLERVIRGLGGLLVIRGETGIGKTRLAQEVVQLARGRGMLVAVGVSLSYGGDIPYLPWGGPLRLLLGISAREPEVQLRQLKRGMAAAGLTSWEPLVAEVLDLEAEETELTASLDARLRQQRLFDLVLELIEHHARRRPLLLMLEDLHWADPASLELLDYVVRNIASCPVLLLLLHRPREHLDGRWHSFGHVSEILLEELPEEDTCRLVTGLLGQGEAPEQLLRLVLHKAQGNPFFAEEMVRALVDAQVLRRDDGRWLLVAAPDQAGVPDTIHGVIQSRIDRLEETERRVLQVASVIGRVFSLPVLSGVYPYDDLDGSLSWRLGRLSRLRLVEVTAPQSRYMFRHTLTQEVAYESLPYARRRELHRRVGRFVEERAGEALAERFGFLAHHFFRGRAWRKALAYSLAAGRKAQREYANEAAIAHFERALQAAAELDEPVADELLEAHERLSEVFTVLGRYDEALKHLAAARALVDTWPPSRERDRKLAALYRRTAEAYEPKGEYQLALSWLERGLSLPGVKGRVEEAFLKFGGAAVYHRRGENELAVEWCRQGLGIAGQVEGREGQEALARGNYLLGLILIRLGRLEEAVENCKRSLLIYEELGDLLGQAQAHNNLAMAYYDQDAWELAAEHYRAAMEIVSRIGYAEGQARVASNLGEIYLIQGNLDAAKEQYQKALEIVKRLGMLFGVALLHNNLGAAYARGEEWDEAAAHLKRSLTLFEEIGSGEILPELFRHLATVMLGQGRLEEALTYAERSLAYAQAHDMRLEEGSTWRVLGQVYRVQGELERAEETLAQALTIAQEARKRHEIALTYLELARLLLQRGERARGIELARQAAQVFKELGARLDLEDAERLLGACVPGDESQNTRANG